MAWNISSGLLLMIVDDLIEQDIDDSIRKDVYKTLINAFEEYEYDTDECLGKDDMFDAAYYEIYPELEDFDIDGEEE